MSAQPQRGTTSTVTTVTTVRRRAVAVPVLALVATAGMLAALAGPAGAASGPTAPVAVPAAATTAGPAGAAVLTAAAPAAALAAAGIGALPGEGVVAGPDPETEPFADGAPAPGAAAPAAHLLAAGTPSGSTTTPPVVPRPPTPAGLPTAVEPLQPYVSAVSCDPRDKLGVTALGDLLRATYPGTSYGISRLCGTDPLRTSEHYEGRAVDWMTNARTALGKARGDAVVAWLTATDAAGNRFAMARRLGVMYVIWNDRIWGSYAATSGWRPYSTCAVHPEPASDTTCHRDHVHISFGWAGARRATSFWTGDAVGVDYGPCRPADLNWAGPWRAARATACPTYPLVTAPAGASAAYRALVRYSGMQLGTGMRGPVVSAVQQVVGTTPDGSYGPATAAAVSAFQTAHDVPATGVVDAATWRAVLAVAAAAQPPTSTPTPSPTPTPKTTTTTAAARPVLRLGSRGPLVAKVQKALHVRADGVFGRQTRAAVIAFQKAHRIPQTGNVGPLTWKALKV